MDIVPLVTLILKAKFLLQKVIIASGHQERRKCVSRDPSQPYRHVAIYSSEQTLRYLMDKILIFLTLVPDTDGPLLSGTEPRVYNGRNPDFLETGSRHRWAFPAGDVASGT
jgi:hypothetical protein